MKTELTIKRYSGAVWNSEIRLSNVDKARVFAVLAKYFRRVDVFEEIR